MPNDIVRLSMTLESNGPLDKSGYQWTEVLAVNLDHITTARATLGSDGRLQLEVVYMGNKANPTRYNGQQAQELMDFLGIGTLKRPLPKEAASNGTH